MQVTNFLFTDMDCDLTKINFPSDSISIKLLRTMHPDQVDTGEFINLFEGGGSSSAAEGITAILSEERTIAAATFSMHLGQSEGMDELKSASEELAKLYVKYGLANGSHHANELIRSIQSQVELQARPYMKNPPRG